MKVLFRTILMGAGIITALVPKVAQSSVTHTVERQLINEIRPITRKRIINTFGGIPLITEYHGGIPGLTPKEYGIRYGNGNSRKRKVNKKHRSHLAKIKNR